MIVIVAIIFIPPSPLVGGGGGIYVPFVTPGTIRLANVVFPFFSRVTAMWPFCGVAARRSWQPCQRLLSCPEKHSFFQRKFSFISNGGPPHPLAACCVFFPFFVLYFPLIASSSWGRTPLPAHPSFPRHAAPLTQWIIKYIFSSSFYVPFHPEFPLPNGRKVVQ